VRVACGSAGRSDFARGQQVLHFLPALFPSGLELACLGVGERIGQATPAHESGKGSLFFWGCAALVRLNGLEGTDGRDVVFEFGNLATFTKGKVFFNLEVRSRDVGGA
jgi:hypothetical protein